MSKETAMIDLFVIGGGINGAGIARDATGRGLKVVLCEKDDLGEGTSSRSGKLVHGGLRYLEYYEFRLVREALIEIAARAGVPSERLFVYDGSRQSNNFTARVTGFGASSRIGISDVAFKGGSLDEVKAVTGHEIASGEHHADVSSPR